MKSTSKGRNSSKMVALTMALFLACGIIAWAQDPFKKGVPTNPSSPGGTKSKSGVITRGAGPRRPRPPKGPETSGSATLDTAPAPGIEEKNAGIESYNKEEYDKAIERLSVAKNLRTNDAQIFYYLGDSYWANKQYKESIEPYERAMQWAPQEATDEHYFNLGYAYEITNENGNASKNYKKAIEKKDSNVEARTHLGDVLSKLGDRKNAIAAYERAYELNPKIDDPEVFFNWGFAYMSSAQREQRELAIEKFKKAIDLKIDNISDAYYQLGRAYKLTGRSQEAVEAYKNQLEKKADDENAFVAYSDLGEIYYAMANWDAALDAFNNAVRINNKDSRAWFSLGSMQHNLGKGPEARISYERAVMLDPSSAQNHSALGKELYRLDRYAEAITTLNKALDLNPKLSEAYFYRGLSYTGLGQYEQAVASLTTGLEIGFESRSDEGDARYTLAKSYSKLGNAVAARQQCDILRTMPSGAPGDSEGVCR